MILRVHGGLCNRLRAILSWRSVYGELTVAWAPDTQVHFERWDEVFMPLSGVRFIDKALSDCPDSYEPHPEAKPTWLDSYRELRPITPTPVFSGEYSAVHMRRTDCIAYQTREGVYEPDEAFVEWCNQSSDPVFVATDNGTTQQRMIAALPGRVITHRTIYEHPNQNESDVRNTTLLHAWWDIETCARATRFKGSGASSFTNLIHQLRALR